jgi:NADPH-dependent 7-cyano-7-deazaguanine reductase QueF-like protein
MMMSLYLWEFKCKTTTKRQVRQEQDNELVQDLSTCCVQYVHVNITPQDKRIDYVIPSNTST